MNCFKRKSHKQSLVFKKWGRKGYSLFSVINHAVHIAVLPVVYFLSAPVAISAVQTDTTGIRMELDLEEIEISAQRSPSLYSQVARVVTVIDASQIEAAPVQSVQELLEYVAGVDLRQRGPGGVQADVSIRGGTFDQTLILLNGINITDPQTGHHNFNLPVTLQQIERLEILEGPAARVYGPNAFSGAINVVTKKPGQKMMNLQATAGSHRYFDAGVSGGFRTGTLNHLMSGSTRSSGGYTNNTDFNIRNLYYSNRLEAPSGRLSSQAGITEKGFGANSFYTARFPNQYENTSTWFASAKWESSSFLHLTPIVYWRRHYDEFMLFRDDAPEWYKSHNYHQTNVWGAGLNSWVQWGLGKTSLGAEFRSESILSNVLGLEMEQPIEVPGAGSFYTRSDNRKTISLFLEHVVYLNRWTFSGGLMSNNISGSDLGWNLFPGVEASYTMLKGVKLFGSYNTSLRMPTFTDLFYVGPTNIGNPDLKPERAQTIEGGLKVNQKMVQGHLVLFYRNGTNIIDWVKMNQEDLWQPQNLTDLTSFGTEMQVRVDLARIRHLPEWISLGMFYNNQLKSNEGFISNYVLDNLRYKLVAAAEQNLFENVSCSVKLIWQDREGTYTMFANQVAVGEVAYDPFMVIDAKINYNYKKLHLFVSAENLFDTTYNDIGNVVQPGRWFKTGISYKLEFN